MIMMKPKGWTNMTEQIITDLPEMQQESTDYMLLHARRTADDRATAVIRIRIEVSINDHQ